MNKREEYTSIFEGVDPSRFNLDCRVRFTYVKPGQVFLSRKHGNKAKGIIEVREDVAKIININEHGEPVGPVSHVRLDRFRSMKDFTLVWDKDFSNERAELEALTGLSMCLPRSEHEENNSFDGMDITPEAAANFSNLITGMAASMGFHSREEINNAVAPLLSANFQNLNRGLDSINDDSILLPMKPEPEPELPTIPDMIENIKLVAHIGGHRVALENYVEGKVTLQLPLDSAWIRENFASLLQLVARAEAISGNFNE